MILEDFKCPVCGGPTNKEEKKKGTKNQIMWYHCLDDKCGTELYQHYDINANSYIDCITLYISNRKDSKIVSTYQYKRGLTAEQWKKVLEGESIPGYGPSTIGPESVPVIQASLGFKTLLGYGQFIAGCGWILIFLAAIVLLVGLAGSIIGLVTGIASSIALVIVGISFVVSGQVISCFVSIERNTRETNELLKQLNK